MKEKAIICQFIFWISIICFPYLAFAQVKNPVIDFASDTQAPMGIEKIYLKADHNEKATEMIFKDIVTNHPSCLFITGDVVSLGYRNSKWVKMDRYLKWCSNENIPVYAALGNHELLLYPEKGKQNFKTRFPMYSPTGYSEIVDSVAVILLNSNFGEMTAAEISTQDNWYNSAIKEMENDAAIKFIIVGCHHSPFTNSKIVNPSEQVRQRFIPAFIKSKKCVLFVSGHSHNFERFNQQGKYFLVIGGGGGLHQPLYEKEITHDLSHDYKPMFHYLEVRRFHDSLYVVSRRLKPDFSGFDDGLKFNIGR
ncbi:MAG TPA: metallophosphoesterase [Mucilaginibacter sp.]|jgi:predicted MPP superfamily phosphohydrolase